MAGRQLADRGAAADWFRRALQDKDINACIPDRKARKILIKCYTRSYKGRNSIEIMFARFKDWRSVKVFLSAITFAATVLF